MIDQLQQHPLGYWQVKTKPTEAELAHYYAKKYYQHCEGSRQKNYSEQEIHFFRAKAKQRGRVAKQLLADKPNETIRLLDVGCGEGFELAYFHQLGWQAKGIDFSSEGIQSQNPQCLMLLTTGNIYEKLEQAIQSHQQYDVIWLQNVLEHVIEPDQLLQNLQKILSPDGVAVITVPNDFSQLQQQALQNNWIAKPFWIALPDHLSYFDAPSLRAIAEANGWVCETLMADFPIDWFLTHDTANYIANPSQGKAAHRARVRLENLIEQQDPDKVIRFWQALADLGMGRNITAFLRHAGETGKE
jgi:2-polyprenyl-3-methyl-5-hydroxy-6-metoxy-1,4-benzoquinol methylase